MTVEQQNRKYQNKNFINYSGRTEVPHRKSICTIHYYSPIHVIQITCNNL